MRTVICLLRVSTGREWIMGSKVAVMVGTAAIFLRDLLRASGVRRCVLPGLLAAVCRLNALLGDDCWLEFLECEEGWN